MGTILGLDEYPENELHRELIARAMMRTRGRCDYCERPASDPPCRFPDRHALAVLPGIEPRESLGIDPHQRLPGDPAFLIQGDPGAPPEGERRWIANHPLRQRVAILWAAEVRLQMHNHDDEAAAVRSVINYLIARERAA